MNNKNRLLDIFNNSFNKYSDIGDQRQEDYINDTIRLNQALGIGSNTNQSQEQSQNNLYDPNANVNEYNNNLLNMLKAKQQQQPQYTEQRVKAVDNASNMKAIKEKDDMDRKAINLYNKGIIDKNELDDILTNNKREYEEFAYKNVKTKISPEEEQNERFANLNKLLGSTPDSYSLKDAGKDILNTTTSMFKTMLDAGVDISAGVKDRINAPDINDLSKTITDEQSAQDFIQNEYPKLLKNITGKSVRDNMSDNLLSTIGSIVKDPVKYQQYKKMIKEAEDKDIQHTYSEMELNDKLYNTYNMDYKVPLIEATKTKTSAQYNDFMQELGKKISYIPELMSTLANGGSINDITKNDPHLARAWDNLSASDKKQFLAKGVGQLVGIMATGGVGSKVASTLGRSLKAKKALEGVGSTTAFTAQSYGDQVDSVVNSLKEKGIVPTANELKELQKSIAIGTGVGVWFDKIFSKYRPIKNNAKYFDTKDVYKPNIKSALAKSSERMNKSRATIGKPQRTKNLLIAGKDITKELGKSALSFGANATIKPAMKIAKDTLKSSLGVAAKEVPLELIEEGLPLIVTKEIENAKKEGRKADITNVVTKYADTIKSMTPKERKEYFQTLGETALMPFAMRGSQKAKSIVSPAINKKVKEGKDILGLTKEKVNLQEIGSKYTQKHNEKITPIVEEYKQAKTKKIETLKDANEINTEQLSPQAKKEIDKRLNTIKLLEQENSRKVSEAKQFQNMNKEIRDKQFIDTSDNLMDSVKSNEEVINKNIQEINDIYQKEIDNQYKQKIEQAKELHSPINLIRNDIKQLKQEYKKEKDPSKRKKLKQEYNNLVNTYKFLKGSQKLEKEVENISKRDPKQKLLYKVSKKIGGTKFAKAISSVIPKTVKTKISNINEEINKRYNKKTKEYLSNVINEQNKLANRYNIELDPNQENKQVEQKSVKENIKEVKEEIQEEVIDNAIKNKSSKFNQAIQKLSDEAKETKIEDYINKLKDEEIKNDPVILYINAKLLENGELNQEAMSRELENIKNKKVKDLIEENKEDIDFNSKIDDYNSEQKFGSDPDEDVDPRLKSIAKKSFTGIGNFNSFETTHQNIEQRLNDSISLLENIIKEDIDKELTDNEINTITQNIIYIKNKPEINKAVLEKYDNEAIDKDGNAYFKVIKDYGDTQTIHYRKINDSFIDSIEAESAKAQKFIDELISNLNEIKNEDIKEAVENALEVNPQIIVTKATKEEYNEAVGSKLSKKEVKPKKNSKNNDVGLVTVVDTNKISFTIKSFIDNLRTTIDKKTMIKINKDLIEKGITKKGIEGLKQLDDYINKMKKGNIKALFRMTFEDMLENKINSKEKSDFKISKAFSKYSKGVGKGKYINTEDIGLTYDEMIKNNLYPFMDKNDFKDYVTEISNELLGKDSTNDQIEYLQDILEKMIDRGTKEKDIDKKTEYLHKINVIKDMLNKKNKSKNRLDKEDTINEIEKEYENIMDGVYKNAKIDDRSITSEILLRKEIENYNKNKTKYRDEIDYINQRLNSKISPEKKLALFKRLKYLKTNENSNIKEFDINKALVNALLMFEDEDGFNLIKEGKKGKYLNLSNDKAIELDEETKQNIDDIANNRDKFKAIEDLEKELYKIYNEGIDIAEINYIANRLKDIMNDNEFKNSIRIIEGFTTKGTNNIIKGIIGYDPAKAVISKKLVDEKIEELNLDPTTEIDIEPINRELTQMKMDFLNSDTVKKYLEAKESGAVKAVIDEYKSDMEDMIKDIKMMEAVKKKIYEINKEHKKENIEENDNKLTTEEFNSILKDFGDCK
jgi:hypothetical protein